jgi:hypothetical protein
MYYCSYIYWQSWYCWVLTAQYVIYLNKCPFAKANFEISFSLPFWLEVVDFRELSCKKCAILAVFDGGIDIVIFAGTWKFLFSHCFYKTCVWKYTSEWKNNCFCLKIYSNNIKVMFFFGKHTSGHMLRGEKRSFLEL